MRIGITEHGQSKVAIPSVHLRDGTAYGRAAVELAE
ncbi:hypothetical protein MLGJGCBP_05049 [Rhodococcus sp. T7]|nr:hypothetical protein MLGJGCBP_05049 [Rhodococcus sp. T7]